jgi:hypothetical protein
MSEKGQRHMVMPTEPGPGLVMIHPQFALGFLNRGLDRPARACQPHQFGLSGRGRSVAQIILDLARIAGAAAKDEPDLVAGRRPRLLTARTNAKSAVIGPLAPSLIV